MSYRVAKIAVSSATYWFDRPYEYLINDDIQDIVVPGIRVFVPFSKSNKICEGIVLSVKDGNSSDGLKSIISVLDDNPVLTESQIKLALFMRERFYCTVYDAFRAMLPSGLWFDNKGRRKTSDKIQKIAVLNITSEEALQISKDILKKSPKQSNLLTELSYFEELPVKDLLNYTGAGSSSLKALVDKGFISLSDKELFRRPEIIKAESNSLPILNDEQQSVYSDLLKLIEKNNFCVSLLQGVTGSGKTSVYIKLIDSVLKMGKSAILLVPEIALTPQMIQTFSGYFGNDVAVLHSSLPVGERYDEWKRIKLGLSKLVIGTRSAVFAPCENLGLIIIDEQQEDTYRSEKSPRYNAEDIAKYLCFKSNSLLLLGSATPDICSSYYARTGKYAYFRLNNRYNKQSLPNVSIVDLKQELANGNDSQISCFLRDEIQRNIDNDEQSILFLNRRGARKLISCVSCGFIYKCPNCSVPLTYHTVGNKLMCHYCGYSKKVDSLCPDCGGELGEFGAGTQLVEAELKSLFPNTEILRVDTDVLSSKVTHDVLFDRFKNEKIPIMIGTQMVTKGLNFDNVTLVGVLNADQSLYSGDYKSGEKTFSLITQVIGRSGRGAKPGRAVIQTFTPENETIIQSSLQDYDGFYDSEIQLRKIQNTPPFCDYLCITVCGKNEQNVISAAKYAKMLLVNNTLSIENIEILGPAPLYVVKVNNVFRYRINIKCNADNAVRKLISDVVIACNNNKNIKGVTFYAENNPID